MLVSGRSHPEYIAMHMQIRFWIIHNISQHKEWITMHMEMNVWIIPNPFMIILCRINLNMGPLQYKDIILLVQELLLKDSQQSYLYNINVHGNMVLTLKWAPAVKNICIFAAIPMHNGHSSLHNTLRSRWNGCHYAVHSFKCILLTLYMLNFSEGT